MGVCKVYKLVWGEAPAANDRESWYIWRWIKERSYSGIKMQFQTTENEKAYFHENFMKYVEGHWL